MHDLTVLGPALPEIGALTTAEIDHAGAVLALGGPPV
jgi:hypothetical protein